MTEICHPEWITVTADGSAHKGYDQDWYPEKRQQISGCGPTVGSMMAAYTRRKLKDKEITTKGGAVEQMLEIWPYATPHLHGLYKTRWLMEGLNHYFSDENLSAEAEMISIPPVRMLAPSFVKVKKFIQEGLAGDWPVGFLNLHSGGEPIPYHWHWMILVRMEEAGGRTICTLWDEGKAMKKIISFLLAGAVLLPGAVSAAFVKSDKLFNDYDRYAVVYMDGTKRIYADTETVEQDYAPAGTLPVIRGKVYTEVYAEPLDYPALGNGRIVKAIVESELAVGADQLGSEIRYRLLDQNVASYDLNGNPVPAASDVKDTQENAQELYLNMYRLVKKSG